MAGAKAFGQQTPTSGEDAVSWQTWSDGAAGVPTVDGDTDWGKLSLPLTGAEGRSAVYDLGSTATRTFTLTENVYGTGAETAVLQYRTSTTSFAQDDVLPEWTDYTAPLSVSCRYVQIREITELALLPQNLLTDAGTLTEGFETIGDWTATEGSVADDATNYISGSHSIAITSASGASGRAHKTVSLNMSAFGRGVCYFRHTDSQGDNPSLYFASDSGLSQYIRYKLEYTPLASLGWQAIHFHEDSMIDDGTGPNTAAIIRFRCRHVAPASQTRVVNFDGLTLGMVGVPAIYFQFEDIRDEHVDAAAYMTTHGMRGSFSVVSDLVGTGGRATWANLNTMEDAGHCLMNATKDHTSLGGLSQAAQQAEFTDCRDAGRTNGIWAVGSANADNWRYLSYPAGSYNSDSLAAFDAEGMRLGFNMVGNGAMFGMPFGQKYMLPFTHLTIAKTIDDLKAYVDLAIARGMLFTCYLEDLGGASISLATFEELIDYLVTKKDQIYTVTADDLYRLQSGSVSVSRSR
jgi:peptidoglycan/xylan/chitin deacetylase (PgdA/CDA1 family)